MKFGICTNMNASNLNKVGIEQIGLYADFGFDYVELPLGEIMLMSDKEFTLLQNALRNANIPCLACNNFIHKGIRLTGPDFNLEAIKTYCEEAIARAGELGAEVIVFGSSGARNKPPGFSKEQAYHQIDLVLSTIAPIANKYKIDIGIEQHNPTEGNMFNHFKTVREAAGRIDHPRINCLLDNYHMGTVLEGPDVFSGIGKKLVHIHISALLNNRAMPLHPDELDYRRLFKALKDEQYDRTMSIEAHSSNLALDVSVSLPLLRQLRNYS